uniref:Uncharacterized protein n=1 Tax=Leptospira ellisii TaxID=2023197 RepID=A0A2N0BAJ8_9LEPT|nr:hypothetical protein CH379_07035 [Leptospira ellisii]
MVFDTMTKTKRVRNLCGNSHGEISDFRFPNFDFCDKEAGSIFSRHLSYTTQRGWGRTFTEESSYFRQTLNGLPRRPLAGPASDGIF